MKNSHWKPAGPEGLYIRTSSGIYYSRYRLNGRRTFRSLNTDVFTVAKLKHASRGADIERDRQRGAELTGEFRTLGGLATEVEARFSVGGVDDDTRIARKNTLARLREHWQQGSFDSFLARNVTADVIANLREYLLHRASWRRGGSKTKNPGYRVPVVNQTLWMLKTMLEIAVEKMVLVENPFTVSTTLRPSLYAKAGARKDPPKLEIPDRQTMNRIFAEMRRVPEGTRAPGTSEEWLKRMEGLAEEMADHAELLAYSGMRREEARAGTLADDRGDEFKIHGTKSKTSDRVIPVNPALRAVLDRIKSRRVGDRTPLVTHAQPADAMNRACDRLGLPRLTNHMLRHFFASVCIASGVDIPTISRWLGHSDGGALAMRTYGHLLKDHSLAAAKRVDFSGQPLPAQSIVG